jgi:hypothetical protein
MKTTRTSPVSRWRILALLITMLLISSLTVFVLEKPNVIFSAGKNVQTSDKKPNILFIMGDDIGWMQPAVYHRGLMVGGRPTSTASRMKAQSSWTMPPCRAARPDATRSSPACIRCARA